jgi:hypothetical protein
MSNGRVGRVAFLHDCLVKRRPFETILLAEKDEQRHCVFGYVHVPVPHFGGAVTRGRACDQSPAAYATATTLYAASGRLIPFNSNSPTGSTFTAFSTFVSTRGLMRICPGLASSHSREATLDTVPMAA